MSQTHTINLTTRDHKEISFPCGEGEHLIEAAAKANITLPSSCLEGNCGACHGNCKSGDHELKSHRKDALPKEDGAILMCRTYPKADLSIEVSADMAHITSGPIAERTCEVIEVSNIGGAVRRLVMKVLPDENGDMGPQFEAGQYMELQIPGSDVKRAYSLANAPNWDGTLEFLIRLQPNGKFSSWLEDKASAGDKLQVKGPEGAFVMQTGTLSARRFVAGGTGVAPMFAMLRQMAEFQEGNDSHLYFGVNTEDDLFCMDQVEDLKKLLPNLTVTVCVWKPGNDWQGYTGSPVDAFAADLKADVEKGLKPEVYLCGPPGLVDATEEASAAAGLSHDNVYCERFLPA
ncbi:MAG: oxidoreductase [Rhodospirillaceae bacterium]|nr:MAG: oxidoreductase [Rhodospirillaceae bacterium]